MSDYFGIGPGMRALARLLFASARSTGRTTRLVESLKDGDRVVFVDTKEARRVYRLCQQRGINIDTLVLSPSTPGGIFERRKSKGRTIFDHSWVEEFYLFAIENAESEIRMLQNGASNREPDPGPIRPLSAMDLKMGDKYE